MHCGSLFYSFLMKTATKKTNSLLLNEEIKLLLTEIALLDKCLASLLSHDPPPPFLSPPCSKCFPAAMPTLSHKKQTSFHWGGTFSKRYNLYHLGTNMYIKDNEMHPLGINTVHICTFPSDRLIYIYDISYIYMWHYSSMWCHCWQHGMGMGFFK